MFEEFGINAGFVEELHAHYQQSPQSVEPKWRDFFSALENGAPQNGITSPGTHENGNGTANGNGVAHSNGGAVAVQSVVQSGIQAGIQTGIQTGSQNGAAQNGASRKEQLLAAAAIQGRVYQLLNAYRVRGHLFAHLDPLSMTASDDAPPELNLSNFGLSVEDLDTTFPTVGIAGLPERATLRAIIAHLTETYCRSIGVEFTQIEEPDAREWLQERMESTRNRAQLGKSQVRRILTKLTDAETFESFIGKNYVGAKRFSVEGAESMIALLDLLVDEAGAQGVSEIVLGMAHRGRLNVLANIMGKNVREIFAAFDDKNPERFLGGGDVKYHLGYSSNRETSSGANVHLSLAFNPSHLEFVNPVVEGRVRAKQDRKKRTNVMPLLIHGDAAFMGQGVVPETLNMAGLDGYSTGGTIHVVVNNQIGFTTVPRDSRSTRYCTDITRMLRCPVFHVNGEDPEAVIQVTRLAVEFRERFQKDVVIDMFCYRKYGHNEADEPRFTQPVMYASIDKKPTVRQAYVARLVDAGALTQEQADQIAVESKAKLDLALEEARRGDWLKKPNAMEGLWVPYYGGPDALIAEVATKVPREKLVSLLEDLEKIPEGFTPNAKAFGVIKKRREQALATPSKLQWETGEALAYATLASEGALVRLSGQDARRGTFSHRHATLFDSKTGASHTALDEIAKKNGTRFEVWDSPLSETGVLGFEYGYSLDRPDGLVIWEAQFGDFWNGAQVIVDQFIVSAEDKWLRLSGLTLLLPHGYEGAGPEHSSARIERFLSLSAEDNIQVCNLTTPAQIFHVLRRQVLRPWRKPLVIFTPKSLLRSPVAVSPLEDLVSGEFKRVIEDTTVNPADVKRVLLCSGKVYYDLAAAREKLGRKDVAIIRLEQLYPLNESLLAALAPYADGTPLVWVQEEPRNMGAWYYLNARVRDNIGERLPLSLVSRDESASPATGSHSSHELEQKMLISAAFS